MQITTSTSFLSELPSNINLLNFSKNTKAAKLVLLTELIYIIINQSRNYNKLYINLILQIEIIKKKLFESINEKLILVNGYNIINLFKLKLKKDNINYENFIKNLIFSDNKINYLINTVVKRGNLEIDSLFLKVLKSIQKEFITNNLIVKYQYLKKIQLYIKQFTFNKFKDINSFFYPIIFNLLKKETHRLKLKGLMRKIITKYIFKGLNIHLSKDKLQYNLLKAFRISNKFNVRIIPFVEEIHLKERKPLKNKKDIISGSNKLVNELVNKFGFGYLKLLRMLKKNNLESIPLKNILDLLLNLEKKTFYGFLKSKGMEYELLKEDFLLKTNNEKYSIFNICKPHQLFLLNKSENFILKKNFLNIYYFYNFYNSLSKRKKKKCFFFFIREKN